MSSFYALDAGVLEDEIPDVKAREGMKEPRKYEHDFSEESKDTQLNKF